MTLEDLGYTRDLALYRKEHQLDSFETGRVTSEHKERYTVKTEKAEFDSELIGNLRFTAEGRQDFPAVGDWVAISKYDDGKALIHAIFPRHSVIERKAVGKEGQQQIIATNIDVGLIVQAVDRDFSINRLERYQAICNASNVSSIVLLSKIDLISKEELKLIVLEVSDRLKEVPIITISNQTKEGYDKLASIIKKGKTYCLLGSSGVGKSTIVNLLSGSNLMKTGVINESIDRGRHTTSHRELFLLKGGGIIVDNPGMREVGMTDSSGGLETTFEVILELAKNCKFKDCSHTSEKGCAVLEAIGSGQLDQDLYTNFLKMLREKEYYESTIEERRRKGKNLGKLIKGAKNAKNHNQF